MARAAAADRPAWRVVVHAGGQAGDAVLAVGVGGHRDDRHLGVAVQAGAAAASPPGRPCAASARPSAPGRSRRGAGARDGLQAVAGQLDLQADARSSSRITSWLTSLSSTSSTRAPPNWRARQPGTRRRRRDPGLVHRRPSRPRPRAPRAEPELRCRAGSLSTPTSPPIARRAAARDGQAEAGAAEAPRGRGVGPARRGNSCASFSAAMPMPVSRTMKAQARIGPRASSDAHATTEPRSVNLTALPQQVEQRLRSRVGSPLTQRRVARGDRWRRLERQPLARARSTASARCASSRREAKVGALERRACRPRPWRDRGCR